LAPTTIKNTPPKQIQKTCQQCFSNLQILVVARVNVPILTSSHIFSNKEGLQRLKKIVI
jgi:hypothetical protein